MKKFVGLTSAALVLAGGTYLVSQGAENNVEVLGASSTQTAETQISLDQAKEIAFDHARVDGNKAVFDDEDLDDDQVWELEFEVEDVEYEFDIDANTGEILDFEIDGEDQEISNVQASPRHAQNQAPSSVPTQTSGHISSQQAVEIALADAGVTGEVDVELDDGVWEVEIETATHEYEYEISLIGEILDREVELDD